MAQSVLKSVTSTMKHVSADVLKVVSVQWVR